VGVLKVMRAPNTGKNRKLVWCKKELIGLFNDKRGKTLEENSAGII